LVFERAHDPYLDYLTTRAAALDVEVRLHREVPDPDLARLYSRAIVTICASRLEPFGLTPLESMACGTPVVAVSQGGLRETVTDGFTGYLVERRATAISEGIARVLAGELESEPHELRQVVLDRWSWDRAATQVEQRLLSLAGCTGEHPVRR
jgi:glycosyltransferase involved in cell wall biosynthesis